MKHPWNSQTYAEGLAHAGRPANLSRAVKLARDRIKGVNADLPVVLTLGHLAHLVDVSETTLGRIVDRHEDAYRVFRVKKESAPGRPPPARLFRTICAPLPPLMRTQRWIAQNILSVATPHEASYAFARNRSLLGAAERHAGCRWLLKMDICNFFESIPEDVVFRVFLQLGYGRLISFQMARLCTRLPMKEKKSGSFAPLMPHSTHNMGHLPQGAPTSPMLANLAVREMDLALETLAKGKKWTYTRYADDLAFSTKSDCTRGKAIALSKAVERVLTGSGFDPNRQKTAIVPPGARKIVLGLLVDRDEPRLTREFRDNLETHLYALTNPAIGPAAHQKTRGFASSIGMQRHVKGLLAFAHMVDRAYAATQYARFNQVDWPG